MSVSANTSNANEYGPTPDEPVYTIRLVVDEMSIAIIFPQYIVPSFV